MKRVILISEHYFGSKRKAGFHFIAEQLWQAGWEVIFVTNYVSRLTLLRGEQRFTKEALARAVKEANELKHLKENFYSYVWFTLWHPFNPSRLGIGILDPFLRSMFKRYGDLPLGPLEAYIGGASLFIFESTPGIMLFDRFKRMNPTARYVYRVSDDLKLLGRHPVVLETESRIAPQFDLISTPSEYLNQKFANSPNSVLQYHGLDKEAFDLESHSPYSLGTFNCIFVGNSFLDLDFLERASRVLPEHYFHIIGPFHDLPVRPNIIRHGEIPFAKTIPYVKYANIGLQTLEYRPGAESFTDTLKVHQYTYCQLPIIAPNFLKSTRSHMFYYTPGNDKSIKVAFNEALKYDRTKIPAENVISWQELARDLAGPTW